MLRVLGAIDRLPGQVARRDALRVGAIGALGLPQLLGYEVPGLRGAEPPVAQAKQVILLFLYGAAAQHELFDPKPEAPVEIRGEFGAIPTSVPGVHIGEHLPRIAQIADRVTLIRSMSHEFNIHAASYTLTGVPFVDIPMEVNRYDPRHWPFFGSVLEYLDQRNGTQRPTDVPGNMALPFPFTSRCTHPRRRAGPYGGFLGRAYDPVWTEFDEAGTESVVRWTGRQNVHVRDPYLAIPPDSQLRLSRDAGLRPDLTLDRLDRRRALHQQLDVQRRAFENSPAVAQLDRFD